MITHKDSAYIVLSRAIQTHQAELCTLANELASSLLKEPSQVFITSGFNFVSAAHGTNLLGFNFSHRHPKAVTEGYRTILRYLATKIGATYANHPVYYESGLPIQLLPAIPAANPGSGYDIYTEPQISGYGQSLVEAKLASLQVNQPLPSASAIYIKHQDTIFLSQRLPGCKSYAGHWQNPGGKIDNQEDPAFAALRETQEETAFDARITHLQFLGEKVIDCPDLSPPRYSVFAYQINLVSPVELKQTEPDKSGPWEAHSIHKLPSPVVPALPLFLPLLKP